MKYAKYHPFYIIKDKEMPPIISKLAKNAGFWAKWAILGKRGHLEPFWANGPFSPILVNLGPPITIMRKALIPSRGSQGPSRC